MSRTFLSVVEFDAPIVHTTQYAGANKKMGGAPAGAVDGWGDTAATIPGKTELMSRAMAQFDAWDVPIVGPFVIPPGKAIGMLCARVGTGLTVNLSGYTEAAS